MRERLKKPVTITRGILAWFLCVIVLSTLIVSAGGVVYTNSVQRAAEERSAEARARGDQRWCRLFSLLVQPTTEQEHETDPDTRLRQEQAREYIRQLQIEYGCVKS